MNSSEQKTPGYPSKKSWLSRIFGSSKETEQSTPVEQNKSILPKSSDRQEIENLLVTRNWWHNTALDLQWYLTALPENCNGALRQLAERAEEGGGVKLVRLVSIHVPNFPGGSPFGLIVNFEVQKLADPSIVYCYQYHLWKQGPKSGSKGVVLVKENDQISHIICLQGFAFAAGKESYDTVGGFSDDPSHTPEEAMIREMHEELNIDPSNVKEVISLGDIFPDRGQTATDTDLFALVVDMSASENVEDQDNTDLFEMNSDMVIIKIEDLWGPEGFLMQNKDSYFSVCVARLISLGVIAPPLG